MAEMKQSTPCLSGANVLRFPIKAFLVGLSLAVTSTATAQSGAPFTIAESGQGFHRLADAVKAVGGRSATIIIAPGAYGDCAVQTAGHITYKAAVAGQAVLDGGVCEGKAALVLRGQGAVIDGIIFQNQRVPDGNGAGIRLEKGNLISPSPMRFLEIQNRAF